MKFINFEHAKKVAMTGLAMTSCGFLLWVSQGLSYADDNLTPTTTTVNQSQAVVAGNTTNSPAATSQQPITTQMQAAASQSYDQNDHGNYAYLDNVSLNPDGELNAAGWHATNAAQNRPYHYIIALNQNHTEIARQNITNQAVSRTDVQRVHNVYGAGQSGFNVQFNLGKAMNNTTVVNLISRYSADPNGNADYVDYYFAPVTIDQRNYACLDKATVVNNKLEVQGWNATNLAFNKNYHYIILLDRTTGKEVSRALVKNGVDRPDVAKVYPGIEGADKSGFAVSFGLNGVNFNHKLQLLSRYAGASDGNSDYVDYYFTPITDGNYSNQGSLDSFNVSDGQHLKISGWHADDISQFENQKFIIIYDNTANTQVASAKVTSVSRPDVAKAYPTIKTAGQSGFDYGFDLSKVNLLDGHSYSVVSRYSTSDEGNGGNGQYTDFWSAPVTYRSQQGYSVDQAKMTDQGLQLAGWMASSQSQSKRNAFIIILNNGQEVTRQKLNLTSRSDVAAVYPLIFNSANSGFNTLIKLNPAAITGNMQIIFRFTDDPAGNGNSADQKTPVYASNQGSFTDIRVNGRSVYVSGWHASDQSANKPYQYLILLDANGREVYRQRVLDINRPDDAARAAAPYILNSTNSGYRLGLTLPASAQGKVFRVIHRFTDDVNGNGNSVDLYSAPLLQYNMTANAINRYILQNRIGHATIQTNYVIPEVTDEYSRTSDGRPDMVVVHETANPNDSIYGEINYEKQTYDKAFVHAFVDGNNIIEISSTDREAWGAGYPANGRAVQFEQVEVYSAANFARELVNGAYYTAYKMKQYGIVPTLAWYNRQTGQYGGTLWSHHMVSQYMHVTDHTDPDGYWANRASRYFGTSYTMGDFFELVKYEYRQL